MFKFKYDPEKCDLPFDPNENRPTNCLKCLEVCPNSLLMFIPMKEKRDDGAPKRYKITMIFKAYGKKFCPDCLKCVEICPSQAITIKCKKK